MKQATDDNRIFEIWSVLFIAATLARPSADPLNDVLGLRRVRVSLSSVVVPQLDAEPRVSAPEDAQPPLATPNLAFNKLATMLTHLISRVRELQAEVKPCLADARLLFVV